MYIQNIRLNQDTRVYIREICLKKISPLLLPTEKQTYDCRKGRKEHLTQPNSFWLLDWRSCRPWRKRIFEFHSRSNLSVGVRWESEGENAVDPRWRLYHSFQVREGVKTILSSVLAESAISNTAKRQALRSWVNESLVNDECTTSRLFEHPLLEFLIF